MIVPFPSGGRADLVAPPVAEAMSRELGQPVVIEKQGQRRHQDDPCAFHRRRPGRGGPAGRPARCAQPERRRLQRRVRPVVGLFIPRDTPEPVAQRLRAAAKAAAQDARVKEVILNAGSPVLYLDSPDFEKYVQADSRRMVEVVKRIGKVE